MDDKLMQAIEAIICAAMMQRSAAWMAGTLQKKPGNNPRLFLLRPFEGLYSVHRGERFHIEENAVEGP